VKRVATSWVVARATHSKTTYIAPSRGVDRFLDSYVITYRTISRRAVGRHPDPVESLGARICYVPAFIPRPNVNPLPQAAHRGFVVQVEIVDIKPTEITFDFQHTLVAPMVG
jgi:hypothetical protein